MDNHNWFEINNKPPYSSNLTESDVFGKYQIQSDYAHIGLFGSENSNGNIWMYHRPLLILSPVEKTRKEKIKDFIRSKFQRLTYKIKLFIYTHRKE